MTGAQLRSLRKNSNLSQAEAAKRLGVHSNTVARYERDEQPIPKPVQILARLALIAVPPKELDDALSEIEDG